MGGDKKKKVELVRALLIAVLVLAVAAILFYDFSFKEPKTFEIQDKCGVFVNVESHTIGSEETCKSRCRAKCDSIEYNFDSAEFEKRTAACNRCTCHCN